MLMSSGNTLERKVAGPFTLSQPTQELPSNTLCLPSLIWPKSLHNNKIYHKDLSPLSISIATITVISANILFCYTFIFKRSFVKMGLNADRINTQLVQWHLMSVRAGN